LRGRPGRLGGGAWRHTGTFESFDGTTRRGTSGYFAVIEQRLISMPGEAGRGVDLFAQLGASDGRFAEIDRHASVGLSAKGPIPGRVEDTVGLMLTTVTLSPRCASAGLPRRETVVEVYYGLRLRPWLVAKPDLQYIVNPGGGGARDSVVGTLRVTLAF
jgi:porin